MITSTHYIFLIHIFHSFPVYLSKSKKKINKVCQCFLKYNFTTNEYFHIW